MIGSSSKISCQRELKSKTWRSKFRSSSHDADLRMRKLGTTAARINRRQMSCQGAIMINFALLIFPLHTLAWNIPGHMLSGAIAYQILQRENPSTIKTVRSVLEKILGTKAAGNHNWKDCHKPNEMKCFLCSLHVGQMTFARWTKPRAVCSGIT